MESVHGHFNPFFLKLCDEKNDTCIDTWIDRQYIRVDDCANIWKCSQIFNALQAWKMRKVHIETWDHLSWTVACQLLFKCTVSSSYWTSSTNINKSPYSLGRMSLHPSTHVFPISSLKPLVFFPWNRPWHNQFPLSSHRGNSLLLVVPWVFGGFSVPKFPETQPVSRIFLEIHFGIRENMNWLAGLWQRQESVSFISKMNPAFRRCLFKGLKLNCWTNKLVPCVLFFPAIWNLW